MKFLIIFVIILVVARADFQLTTFLDNFRETLVWLRQTSLKVTKRNTRLLFEENMASGKLQNRIAKFVHFPCNTTNFRSFVRPTNINQLKPGDIDVIASMGDSLTAANGGMSNNILHILNENRAISFSGGGKGTWREYLTLPNILKEFNPNLYGYSVNDVLALEKESRLNVAEPMIMSRDMTYQARTLIKRMKADRKVNMERDWKLLSIFVGNNDVCSDMCHHRPQINFANQHEKDLESTLRLLRDNIPRLFVQIIPVPNMVELYNMRGSSTMCYLVHRIGCSCIFRYDVSISKLDFMKDVILDWQKRELDLCQRPEFNTKDFVAVVQPFTATIKLPKNRDGTTDMRFFASDCFHFSQKGHALMANSLWNNMMQPNGKKHTILKREFEYFECPSKDDPYIKTNGFNYY